jgi:hypothetical protein
MKDGPVDEDEGFDRGKSAGRAQNLSKICMWAGPRALPLGSKWQLLSWGQRSTTLTMVQNFEESSGSEWLDPCVGKALFSARVVPRVSSPRPWIAENLVRTPDLKSQSG